MSEGDGDGLKGIGGNGSARGSVQGEVTRQRHDGVCLTTVRRAEGGAKKEEFAVKRPGEPHFRLLTGNSPHLPSDSSCSVQTVLVKIMPCTLFSAIFIIFCTIFSASWLDIW